MWQITMATDPALDFEWVGPHEHRDWRPYRGYLICGVGLCTEMTVADGGNFRPLTDMEKEDIVNQIREEYRRWDIT